MYVEVAAKYKQLSFLDKKILSAGFVIMSSERSQSSERESVSGGGGGSCCSGASLTAAVLTHVHHDDSEEETAPVVTAVSNRESDGEGDGRKEGELKTAREGEGGTVCKSPSRTARRRSKHSPSKKRESE